LLLDDPEGAVLVHLGRSRSCSCSRAGPVHGNIAVFIPPCLAVALSIVLFDLARVQPCRLLAVRCDDGDFVGVVAGQMGVDKDEDVGYRGGEREGVFQEGPRMGVCVEDDCQQGRGGIFIFESVRSVGRYFYLLWRSYRWHLFRSAPSHLRRSFFCVELEGGLREVSM
jgi:hypothetical protein